MHIVTWKRAGHSRCPYQQASKLPVNDWKPWPSASQKQHHQNGIHSYTVKTYKYSEGPGARTCRQIKPVCFGLVRLAEQEALSLCEPSSAAVVNSFVPKLSGRGTDTILFLARQFHPEESPGPHGWFRDSIWKSKVKPFLVQIHFSFDLALPRNGAKS